MASGDSISARAVLALGLALAGLASAADLAIQRLSLHQYEDGPLLATAYEYLPGETGWFTGRVTGYQREAQANADGKGADQRVRLSWTAKILDPAGILIEAPQTGRIDSTLQAEDKDWVAKFGLNFTVPPFAPRGTYRIPVTIKDEVAGREISGEITFRVRGEELPTAKELNVSNFRFLAREEDRIALQPATYRQGDDVIVRFDVAGYAFAEKNRFKVEYGIDIFGPPKTPVATEAGVDSPLPVLRPLFSQPPALFESEESFYPQRRMEGGFRVKLDANVQVGVHTFVLTVRDGISGKTQQIRQPFEVR